MRCVRWFCKGFSVVDTFAVAIVNIMGAFSLLLNGSGADLSGQFWRCLRFNGNLTIKLRARDRSIDFSRANDAKSISVKNH